ncbi:Glucose dehydrogenase [FAD, quinone], partial [Orchesella cincta]
SSRPKSRGTLRLNATAYKSGVRSDDVKLALIDFKIFEGKGATDMDVLLEGVDFMFKLLNSTTMQKYGAVYREDHHPACKEFEFFSRKFGNVSLTKRLQTGITAVQGISNLRVADASVFPAVPNANINGPVMMLAEKAASDIFQTWIGAGTAGCIIARRLSEKFNVLLLEAGGEPVPASQVPYFVQHVGYDPGTNYFWPSVPQRFASQDTDGVIISHLGKMLGGSGSHNDMVHNRGSPKDYDNYAEVANDSSWRYENVLEHFKKYENFIGELFTGEHEGK